MNALAVRTVAVLSPAVALEADEDAVRAPTGQLEDRTSRRDLRRKSPEDLQLHCRRARRILRFVAGTNGGVPLSA